MCYRIKIKVYYLYLSRIVGYYISTNDKKDKRYINPECMWCEKCGNRDELIGTFYSLEEVACCLKINGAQDEEIVRITGVRVTTERVVSEDENNG